MMAKISRRGGRVFNNIQSKRGYNKAGPPGPQQAYMWRALAANVVLLCVASVFVAEVAMSEEMVVTILTGLCVAIL
jgi:hypothetical protein